MRQSDSKESHRLALLLAATGMICACSEPSGGLNGGGAHNPTTTATTTTSGPNSSTTTGITTSGDGGVGNGGPCQDEPLPTFLAPGWVEYTDWSCKCRFFLPGSKLALPQPPSWEPCPTSPPGIACQAMVVDWTDDWWAISLAARMHRDGVGDPVIAFRRRVPDHPAQPHVLDVISEPDGPTRFGMAQLTNSAGLMKCVANIDDLREGYQILNVRGAVGSIDDGHRGAIGGRIDQLHPPVIAHWNDGHERGWACGAQGLARVDDSFELVTMPWDLSTEHLVSSPAVDPDHINATQPLFQGDSFFFSTATLQIDGINVWDAVHGTRPFVRWPGDYTRGAADLGTDGVDLVWTYGEGKQPSEGIYPVRSVVTAPFTGDPTALEPRRLRSAPFVGIGNQVWQVGCGHAVHLHSAWDLFVVRLTDGVSWMIEGTQGELELLRPLGVTCDEVFALGKIGGVLRIARIRLDSLGLGIAPD